MTRVIDARERIVRVAEGEPVAEGVEIVRILHETAELVGPGANYRTVYVVVVRDKEAEQ